MPFPPLTSGGGLGRSAAGRKEQFTRRSSRLLAVREGDRSPSRGWSLELGGHAGLAGNGLDHRVADGGGAAEDVAVLDVGLLRDDGGHGGAVGVLGEHHDAVELAGERAARQGWVNGYPDGTFRPEDSVSRAEMTKMLLAATGLEPESAAAQWMKESAQEGDAAFTDMDKNWLTAQGWTDTALAAGLLFPADYPGEKFLPGQAITRGEIAVLTDALLRAVDGVAVTAGVRVNGVPVGTVEDGTGMLELLRGQIRGEMPEGAAVGNLGGRLQVFPVYSRLELAESNEEMIRRITALAPVFYLDKMGKLV